MRGGGCSAGPSGLSLAHWFRSWLHQVEHSSDPYLFNRPNHLIHAATQIQGDILVTMNTKDFPTSTTRPLGVDAISPDTFLRDLFELNRPRVAACLQAVAIRHRRYPCTVSDILLSKGLNETAPTLANTCHEYLKETTKQHPL